VIRMNTAVIADCVRPTDDQTRSIAGYTTYRHAPQLGEHTGEVPASAIRVRSANIAND
jgi:hypothetical protein